MEPRRSPGHVRISSLIPHRGRSAGRASECCLRFLFCCSPEVPQLVRDEVDLFNALPVSRISCGFLRPLRMQLQLQMHEACNFTISSKPGLLTPLDPVPGICPRSPAKSRLASGQPSEIRKEPNRA